MNMKVWGACLSGLLLALASAPMAGAGGGQAVARAATAEPPPSRLTRLGYGQSYDWHRPRGAARADRPAVRPRMVLASGRADWVCAPAGAGSNPHCRLR